MSSFIDEMMRTINPPPQPEPTGGKGVKKAMNYYYVATHADGKTEQIQHLPTWCEGTAYTSSEVGRVCNGKRAHIKGTRFERIMRN